MNDLAVVEGVDGVLVVVDGALADGFTFRSGAGGLMLSFSP